MHNRDIDKLLERSTTEANTRAGDAEKLKGELGRGI
jgi:hypothetical protein